MNKDTKQETLCTEELMKLLETSHEIESLLKKNENSITNPDMPSYMSELLDKHNMTIQEVSEKAVLSRSFGYQIINGIRNPNRNILLRLAIVMRLNIDETQHLLKISQRGELYPKVRRDAAIIFCLKNGCSLYETDELLESIEESTLI